jgi:hypothetical protein
MSKTNWKSSSLIPLDFTPVGVAELSALKGNDVISKHTGTVGSIAFVVRRPG